MNIFSRIFNVIFPNTCAVCGYVINGGYVCSNCMKYLSFITNPMCQLCGLPFKFYNENESHTKLICLNCLTHKPYFDKAISVLNYNEIAKQIILPFKHGDKTFLKNCIADLMFKFGKDIIYKADFIVPVPISFTRLLIRKYNQSALIASVLCKKSNKQYLEALKRIKFNRSQGHLSKKDRISNVKNCFIVREKSVNKIKNKNILLIDDVFTTGATVNECAKILKESGAHQVFVLTFCKVC